MDETKLFAKIKVHIAFMAQTDPAYAAWARENYLRMLAIFFVKGGK